MPWPFLWTDFTRVAVSITKQANVFEGSRVPREVVRKSYEGKTLKRLLPRLWVRIVKQANVFERSRVRHARSRQSYEGGMPQDD